MKKSEIKATLNGLGENDLVSAILRNEVVAIGFLREITDDPGDDERCIVHLVNRDGTHRWSPSSDDIVKISPTSLDDLQGYLMNIRGLSRSISELADRVERGGLPPRLP